MPYDCCAYRFLLTDILQLEISETSVRIWERKWPDSYCFRWRGLSLYQACSKAVSCNPKWFVLGVSYYSFYWSSLDSCQKKKKDDREVTEKQEYFNWGSFYCFFQSLLSLPFSRCQPDINIFFYEHCANGELYSIYIINLLFYNTGHYFMNTVHFCRLTDFFWFVTV